MTATAYAVSGVLDRRERELESRLLGRCVVAAILLHLAGLGASWIVPRLTKKPATPIEYVAIQIVPAARLGVEKPPAPKPEPPAKGAKQKGPRRRPTPPPPTPGVVMPTGAADVTFYQDVFWALLNSSEFMLNH